MASLCSSAVFAADLPSRLPPPPIPYVPAFTWSGIYIGGNLGLGGDRFQYPFYAGFGTSGQASITSSGIIGGGQVGYNWQFANNFLLGFETDFDGAAIRGKVTVYANTPIGGLSADAGSRINYIGTVRARAGYALDRLLIYGTGGFAYGQVNDQLQVATGPLGLGAFSTSHNYTRTGWTAGAGVEYAITNNITLKTEYLYVNLGTNSIFNSSLLGFGVNINQKTTANIVRAGLNYKFDWFNPAPVVAKY
ncbi:porin family protein [Methylocapsa polymorpha]|uniref:Porin family protein n=1 Tax=Methylocapsa polymorpha TaxID=3080828 RepID=A0ABZ0HPI3_9HYPH|nr:porin family protein [Methylocapsa sp. RX1]